MAASEAPVPAAGTCDHEDAAWVRIATPLCTADLRAFLDDVERLYRINPLLEISAFAPAGGGRYRLAAHNHSNATDLDMTLDVRVDVAGLEILYDHGLKTITRFRVEATPEGTHLVVTDIYEGSSAEERHARAGEADLSLNAWGRALHSYLRMWARWSWFAPWRWYMRRVWQPMKPSARRIVWMIWVILAFEVVTIAALLLALGVWWLSVP